jgi:Ca2+-transporting ATPase
MTFYWKTKEVIMQSNSPVELKLKELGTDPHRGLTSEQVRVNREKYGSNELSPPERDPLWKQYLEKFEDPTIIILSVCAGLALMTGIYRGVTTGEWLAILEAAAILVAVMIATGVGFWLEYKADKAFELLKAESENVEVKVTRDGAFHTVLVNDLVAGDLVHLESGDKIPADGLIVEGSSLRVDQSVWNGEPEPATKDKAHDPVLVGGTDVVEGNASIVITAAGDNSERGKIAKVLGETERERTPLEQKLDALANLINIAGTGAAALIFASIFGAGIMQGELGGKLDTVGQIVLLIVAPLIFFAVMAYSFTKQGREKPVRTIVAGWGTVFVVGLAIIFIWGTPLSGQGTIFNNFLDNVFSPLLHYFMLAVTIIVVAVPEGLPMAITISLALSMRKIRQDNNLVRKMIATETIGSANIICSDKTGTLTLNRMSVDRIYLHGQLYNRGSDGQAINLADHPAFEQMALISACNSTAHLEEKSGELKFVGNHTEGALLKWLKDQDVAYEDIRERVPVIERIEFTSERKMMSSVVSQNGQQLVLSKGAPERIIACCTQIEVDNGRVEPIEKHRGALDECLDEMTGLAMRPLALAYKSVNEGDSCKTEEIEDGLTLLALVGISDPVRPDVPAAVETCKQADIEVKMVTGDHEKTARVVAERIGILDDDSIVKTGEQFEAMSDNEIIEVNPRLRVLARFNPLQKERLVRLLQSLGEVVAVTGDGTNDAPALKTADVGISMGRRGTDIAKEASDIVLVDDNFGSIVRAVHWGRTLYENVQKFLQFQLTINLSALAIAFLSPLLAMGIALLADKGIHILPHADFRELPLTILQLLWINLIMDTLAALGLSLEPRRDELMKEPPKRRGESFITRSMTENILVMGVYFILVTLVMQATGWYLGADASDATQVGSVLFTTYVFMQIFNLFNARSVRPDRSAFAGVLASRNFQMVLGLIVVVQILLTQFGGATFNTSPLPLSIWIKILLIGASALLLGELYRFVRRRLAKA